MLRSRLCDELDEISHRSWRPRQSSPHNAKDYRAAGNRQFTVRVPVGRVFRQGIRTGNGACLQRLGLHFQVHLGVAIGRLEGSPCSSSFFSCSSFPSFSSFPCSSDPCPFGTAAHHLGAQRAERPGQVPHSRLPGVVGLLGRRRSRMQADRRQAQARRRGVDGGRRQRHHRPAPQQAQRPLRGFLGATVSRSHECGTSNRPRPPLDGISSAPPACAGALLGAAAVLTGVVLDAAPRRRSRRRSPRRSPCRDAAGYASSRCGWWPSGSNDGQPYRSMARGCGRAPVDLAFRSVQGHCGSAWERIVVPLGASYCSVRAVSAAYRAVAGSRWTPPDGRASPCRDPPRRCRCVRRRTPAS